MKLTFFVLSPLLIGIILFQIFYLHITDFSDIIPNIESELIGIMITVFIVDRLLDHHKEKKARETINEIIGNQYTQFVQVLANRYVHFIIKRTPSVTLSSESIDLIVKNIDRYVNDDFTRQDIRMMGHSGNPSEEYSINEVDVQYFVFSKDHFRNHLTNIITEFLSRFISILPEKVKIPIFKISDILKSESFYTPQDFGLDSSSEFIIDIEKLRENLGILGEEIIKLQNIN